jgi:hypothetical protein
MKRFWMDFLCIACAVWLSDFIVWFWTLPALSSNANPWYYPSAVVIGVSIGFVIGEHRGKSVSADPETESTAAQTAP